PSLHTSHLAATSTSYLYIHTPTPHIYTLSLHDALPISINSSAARSAASSGESFESSPPGRLPSSSTLHARLPFERSRGGSISSRTPAAIDSRSADSRRASSCSFSERMSTLMRASCGTEL